jgi:hypothetical protein
MRNATISRIAAKADKLAIEYNKTKDPSIKDQWYKTIKSVENLREDKYKSRKVGWTIFDRE